MLNDVEWKIIEKFLELSKSEVTNREGYFVTSRNTDVNGFIVNLEDRSGIIKANKGVYKEMPFGRSINKNILIGFLIYLKDSKITAIEAHVADDSEEWPADDKDFVWEKYGY